MKIFPLKNPCASFTPQRSSAIHVATLLFVCWSSSVVGSISAADAARTFPTPQDAVTALARAVNTTNRAALANLFGPDSETLANPDSVQGAREINEFAAAFNATNHLAEESKSRMILEVGTNAWPFPIPLVKSAGGWQFDTTAGLEEI